MIYLWRMWLKLAQHVGKYTEHSTYKSLHSNMFLSYTVNFLSFKKFPKDKKPLKKLLVRFFHRHDGNLLHKLYDRGLKPCFSWTIVLHVLDEEQDWRPLLYRLQNTELNVEASNFYRNDWASIFGVVSCCAMIHPWSTGICRIAKKKMAVLLFLFQ